MNIHTILGANGTIAKALVPVLLKNGETVRLVSRNPNPVNGTSCLTADLLRPEQVYHAVKGSSIVYLTVGLQYKASIWEEQWPIIMRNVIEACQEHGARLIFFDDAYMYGKQDGIITENTPYNPCSKKGEIRAEIANMLESAICKGTIKATIARAVDFYGPGVTDKSAPGVYVFTNLLKGKKAQWPINARVPRSFNYVPDAAQALYMLAKDEQSFGQIWHLPTAKPLTGEEFVRLAASHFSAKSDIIVVPKWLLRVIGWFNAFMREAYEMNYQDEFPLVFNSSKFERAFNFVPTSYEEGIKETAQWFSSNLSDR